MRLRVKVLRVPALVAASLICAASARAEPFSAEYQIYFGGLHVLNAEATWQRDAGSYLIEGTAETQGFLNWLHPWKGNTASRGRLEAGTILPQLHENWSSADEGERLSRLTYDAEGRLVDSLVEPAQDWDERHPLPSDPGRGTIDPLSVLSGLSLVLQEKGRCEGEFSVFDGRKRYDLVVSDAGTTELEQTSYSIYAGPARGCQVDYKMLGGHRIARNKYAETSRRRIVWVAQPSESAPLVPVRLEIETAFGNVMGHLTGFSELPPAEAKLTN